MSSGRGSASAWKTLYFYYYLKTITQTCVWVAIVDRILQLFITPSLSFQREGRGEGLFLSPSPFRERVGVRVSKLLNLNKLNILMSSGRGSFVYFF